MRIPKILLLGDSQSGKTTLGRAMESLVYANLHDIRRRGNFKETIFGNIVSSMRILLEAMESLQIPLDDDRLEHDVQTIFMQSQSTFSESLHMTVTAAAEALWADQGVQEAYRRRREYELDSNMHYFMSNIRRIGAANYCPSIEDVLQ